MDQEKIGKFISECRTEKNLTQQELANKLNITDKAVSKWENGRCMPDLELIKPLCEILGVTINELLSGEKLTEENYQQKLEENIIQINLTKVKETLKIKAIKILKGILMLIVLSPILTLVGIIGYSIIQEYNYVKIEIPSSKLKINMCKEEGRRSLIWFSVSHIDGKAIFVDGKIDKEKRTLTIETYRRRFEVRNLKKLEGYQSSALVGYEITDFDEIYYEDKLLWNKDMTLEKCDF